MSKSGSEQTWAHAASTCSRGVGRGGGGCTAPSCLWTMSSLAQKGKTYLLSSLLTHPYSYPGPRSFSKTLCVHRAWELARHQQAQDLGFQELASAVPLLESSRKAGEPSAPSWSTPEHFRPQTPCVRNPCTSPANPTHLAPTLHLSTPGLSPYFQMLSSILFWLQKHSCDAPLGHCFKT